MDTVSVSGRLDESDPWRRRRRGIWASVWGSWPGRAGLVIVLSLVLVAILGPTFAPYDPIQFGPERLSAPSWSHLLGTDRLGRDIMSRLIHGTRLSLGTAFVASVIIIAIGLLVGLTAGFLGGTVDSLLMRVVDIVLAFPSLILALSIAGLFGGSLFTLIVALCSVWWAGYARIVRGLVLSLRERGFVEASRSFGAGNVYIIHHHLLPNLVSPIVVLATLEIGTLILVISALNFLGLGVQPPTPEWGAMINDGRNFLFSAPHALLAPGFAISLTVLGFNLLGDALRDVYDPKLH